MRNVWVYAAVASRRTHQSLPLTTIRVRTIHNMKYSSRTTLTCRLICNYVLLKAGLRVMVTLRPRPANFSKRIFMHN